MQKIFRIPLLAPISILAMIFTMSACKIGDVGDSKLDAAASNSAGGKTDFTTYKKADAKVFAGMKKEMTKNKFNYDAMAKALAKTKLQGGMTKDEAIALRLYTSSAYSKVNTALRTKKASSLSIYANIVKAAASGLNKIPAKACTTKRGLDLPTAIVDKIIKAKRFEEQGFMSTSPTVPAAFQKNITFIIKSKACHDISSISEFPKDKEILFPPGSNFIVTKSLLKKKGSSWAGNLELEHVPGGTKFKAITSGAKQNVVPTLTGSDKNDYPKLASSKPKTKLPAAGKAGATPGKAGAKTTAQTPAKKTKLLGLTEVSEANDEELIESAEYKNETAEEGAVVDTETPDAIETAVDFSGMPDTEVLDLNSEPESGSRGERDPNGPSDEISSESH